MGSGGSKDNSTCCKKKQVLEPSTPSPRAQSYYSDFEIPNERYSESVHNLKKYFFKDKQQTEITEKELKLVPKIPSTPNTPIDSVTKEIILKLNMKYHLDTVIDLINKAAKSGLELCSSNEDYYKMYFDIRTDKEKDDKYHENLIFCHAMWSKKVLSQ